MRQTDFTYVLIISVQETWGWGAALSESLSLLLSPKGKLE